MKRIIILLALLCQHAIGYGQSNKSLKDGLYLVDKVVLDSGTVVPLANQVLVHFNPDFRENAPADAKGLLINSTDFVPLELAEEPLLVPQTENRKKLLLTFSRTASEKLERFTGDLIMKQATMIVNGEALTLNKIREAIHGGKMEITSSDNACERIYVTLKDNVKQQK